MPSGSHGGGGGSHFGGGGSSFSSGGSHFGSSRSHYGGPRGPRGPIFVHFGGRYYTITSGKRFLVLFLFFVSIFACVLGAGLIASNNESKLDVIREDYAYYYQMVELATNNSNYKTTATITGVYKKYSGKYYYKYRFKMHPSSSMSTFTIDGYTYCLYTEDDLSDIYVGKSITIAISDEVDSISFDCDSVPMDIVNFRPEDDGEFQALERSANTNKKVGIIILIIAGGVLATTIILYFVFIKKTSKEEYEKSKSRTSIFSSINTSTSSKSKYCSYCGTALNSNATSCSNCGAKISKE